MKQFVCNNKIIYAQNERHKKLEYNDRVIYVEQGTLNPLIFSTTGGWGREATRFHKQSLIAEKNGQQYGDVMNSTIKRIRFCLLRTILESLRGTVYTRCTEEIYAARMDDRRPLLQSYRL